MERKVIVAALGLVAFVFGVGVGAAASEDADAQLVVAQLTGEVADLQDVLNESRPAEELEQLEGHVEALEGEVADARSAADDAEARLADKSKKLEARSAELDDREAELDAREDEVEAREASVASAAASSGGSGGSGGSQAASQQETRSEPEPSGGCQSGQVDINSAGLQELQRIHEIGPARAEQIVALRPFRSVDDLVRVSGIAEARLGAIKHQGVACVG